MDDEYLKPEKMKDVEDLANFISMYLCETASDVTFWDCEHLAINLIDKLYIKREQKEII